MSAAYEIAAPEPTAAALLREARTRRGMTQRELAAAAQVPQSMVAKIESGARQPTLPTLQRLLSVAGFSMRPKLANSRPPSQLLREKRQELLALARSKGIARLRVFGSVARGEDGPDSDLDLLIDVDPDAPDRRAQLTFDEEAQDLLGCRVDVVQTSGIDPILRRSILARVRELDDV